MKGHVIALPDQSGQAPRIDIGMLFLLCESELQDLAFQFDWALAASLARQQRSKPQLSKSLLNLIEAFSAETELAAPVGLVNSSWSKMAMPKSDHPGI